MPLTPEQLTLRGRSAAYTRWANEDPAATAERGQAGLRARFDREVRDATPGLTEAEYARRSAAAYKAHFCRLAFASSKARGARKAAGDAA